MSTDFEAMLQRIGLTDEEQICDLTETLTPEMKETFLHDSFRDLLTQTCNVEMTNKIDRLSRETSNADKEHYLSACRCAIDNNDHFTDLDARMISHFDQVHEVDSILLLALKARILNSRDTWQTSFRSAGGFQVLIENIGNCLDVIVGPGETAVVHINLLYELMTCVHTVIARAGSPNEALLLVIETHRALDVIIMTLQYDQLELSLKVLDVLNVILCNKPTENNAQSLSCAMKEIMAGFKHLADIKSLSTGAVVKPMDYFVDTLANSGNIRIKLAILSFLNLWMEQLCGDVGARMHMRLILEKSQFSGALQRAADTAQLQAAETEAEPEAESSEGDLTVEGEALEDGDDSDHLRHVDTRCRLNFEGSNEGYLAFRSVLESWVFIDENHLHIWRSSTGTLSQRPEEPALLSIPLSTVVSLDAFCTDCSVQALYPMHFRVLLRDGSKINFAFMDHEIEYASSLCDQIGVAIQHKRNTLSVWCPKAKVAVADDSHDCWVQQLNFFREIESFDIKTLREQIISGDDVDMLTPNYLFECIEWRVAAQPAERQSDMRDAFVQVLKSMALGALNAEQFDVVGEHEAFLQASETGDAKHKDQLIRNLEAEVAELKSQLSRHPNALVREKSVYHSELAGGVVKLLAAKVERSRRRKTKSHLVQNFFYVTDKMVVKRWDGKLTAVMNNFKPPEEVRFDRHCLQRNDPRSGYGRYAPYIARLRQIRTDMVVDRFNPLEVKGFFQAADEATSSQPEKMQAIIKSVEDAGITTAGAGAGAGAGAEVASASAGAGSSAVDPEMNKYAMMKKTGIPEGAIRIKMTTAGISEARISAFFSGNASDATDGGAGAGAGAGAGTAVVPEASPVDSELSKYAMMKKTGIPEGAIRIKMAAAGISEARISAFFSGSARDVDGAGAGASPAVVAEASPVSSELNKYAIMKKTGIPEGAIRIKMAAAGISEAEISTFFSGNSGVRVPIDPVVRPGKVTKESPIFDQYRAMTELNADTLRALMLSDGLESSAIDVFFLPDRLVWKPPPERKTRLNVAVTRVDNATAAKSFWTRTQEVDLESISVGQGVTASELIDSTFTRSEAVAKAAVATVALPELLRTLSISFGSLHLEKLLTAQDCPENKTPTLMHQLGKLEELICNLPVSVNIIPRNQTCEVNMSLNAERTHTLLNWVPKTVPGIDIADDEQRATAVIAKIKQTMMDLKEEKKKVENARVTALAEELRQKGELTEEQIAVQCKPKYKNMDIDEEETIFVVMHVLLGTKNDRSAVAHLVCNPQGVPNPVRSPEFNEHYKICKIISILCHFPMCRQRLLMHNLLFSWDKDLQAEGAKVKTLLDAVSLIERSLPRFQEFSRCALSVTNFVNSEKPNLCKAVGLYPDDLVKLAQAKAPRGNMTLLHVAHQVYCAVSAEGTPFMEQWCIKKLTACVNLPLNVITDGLRDLRLKAEKVREDVNTIQKRFVGVHATYPLVTGASLPIVPPVVGRTEDFLSNYDCRLEAVEYKLSEFHTRLMNLRALLCFRPVRNAECPSATFFDPLLKITLEYDKLLKSIKAAEVVAASAAASPPAAPTPPPPPPPPSQSTLQPPFVETVVNGMGVRRSHSIGGTAHDDTPTVSTFTAIEEKTKEDVTTRCQKFTASASASTSASASPSARAAPGLKAVAMVASRPFGMPSGIGKGMLKKTGIVLSSADAEPVAATSAATSAAAAAAPATAGAGAGAGAAAAAGAAGAAADGGQPEPERRLSVAELRNRMTLPKK